MGRLISFILLDQRHEWSIRSAKLGKSRRDDFEPFAFIDNICLLLRHMKAFPLNLLGCALLFRSSRPRQERGRP
jgi:hypothetical protein